MFILIDELTNEIDFCGFQQEYNSWRAFLAQKSLTITPERSDPILQTKNDLSHNCKLNQ